MAIIVTFTQAEGCGRRYSRIESLSFSSDGSRIAVSKLNARDARVPGKGYSANVSRTLSLINATNGATISRIHQDFLPGDQGPAFALWRRERTSSFYNPSNNQIIAHKFGGGEVSQYPTDGGEPTVLTALAHPAFHIAISDSGTLVAASGMHEISVVNTLANKQVMRVDACVGNGFLRASLLCFSREESILVAASCSGVHAWDIATGTMTSTIIDGREHQANALSLIADDSLLISSNKWLRRYDLTGHVIETIADTGKYYACDASDDGQRLAVVNDADVRIFDGASGNELHRITFGFANALAFSPDSSRLVIGNSDGEVSLVDAGSGERKWTANPPGRYRLPWTVPGFLLVVWLVIAKRLTRRTAKHGEKHNERIS